MKAKKFIALLLCAGMVTMGLAGCGSSSSGSSSSDSSESSDGEGGISGSLTVWEHDYSYEDSLEEVIAGFNELYPDVEVNYQIKADGDYDSLLKTAIQSGDGPDLFWTNGTATTTMPDLVENGVCLDLTDVVDVSFIEESSPNALDLGYVDDGLYSIQWLTLDTRTCYYNKDMFEENGWEIPETFSEFEELLATIKATGTTPIALALDSWCLLFAYEPILAAYDPEYCAGLQDYSVLATDEPAAEAMELMIEWADAGYFGDNWHGVLDSSAQILAFTTSNAAMTIGGSWDAETIALNNPDLNFGAFTIPAEDGSTALVGTAANGFSVNADSDNLDAALAFANYCASLEAQTIWVQSQGAVSASSEIEATSEVAQEIAESGGDTQFRSWQNVLATYSSTGNASSYWSEDFVKIFTGEMTVDELMDEIAAEME